MAKRLPNGSTIAFGTTDCKCECAGGSFPGGGCLCFSAAGFGSPITPAHATLVAPGCPCMDGRVVPIGTQVPIAAQSQIPGLPPSGEGICRPDGLSPPHPFTFPTEPAYFGGAGEFGLDVDASCLPLTLPVLPPTHPFWPFAPPEIRVSVVIQCCSHTPAPPSPERLGYMQVSFLAAIPVLNPGGGGSVQSFAAVASRSDRQFSSFRCSPFQLIVDLPVRTGNLCQNQSIRVVFTE